MTSPASSFAPSARIPNSVFISYASADRAAAKKLHDALVAARLDVWLDDEELAGGEAWDAKIRLQIRTCTYFMPVISATTETRGEGYFRREWRLAVERTLDLADDVLFLVPVVIDNTSEHGARVPDKFGTVQWLHCPDGIETPALAALARRMAGGASQTHVAALSSVSSFGLRHENRSTKLFESDAVSIPYRAFPAFPNPGQHLRFFLRRHRLGRIHDLHLLDPSAAVGAANGADNHVFSDAHTDLAGSLRAQRQIALSAAAGIIESPIG